MSENVKKIRELNDFVDVPTPISIDDILIIATAPSDSTASPPVLRRDKDGNDDPVAAKTLKATIGAVMTAYNASLIPPAGGGGSTDPAERPSVPVDNGAGGTYEQDTTPFTAANLEQMIGSGCGLKITDICHDSSKQLTNCSPLSNVAYKTKKICIDFGDNSDLEVDASGNIKLKDGSTAQPELAPGGGLTLDEDGKLRLETDPEQFGFVAYMNTSSPSGTTLNGGQNITTTNGKRVIGDRFSSWTHLYNYISANTTSNKGTIWVIFESDINESPGNGNAMTIPAEWPHINFVGNKAIGEYKAGIASKPASQADLNGQTKAIWNWDMSSNNLYSCLCRNHNQHAEMALIHFQVSRSTTTDMYSIFRSNGELHLTCCKIEIMNNGSTMFLQQPLEAIRGGRLELHTPSRLGSINSNGDRSDPLFLGSDKNHASIEIKNCTGGSVLRSWEGGSTFKMVEYAFQKDNWTPKEEFTGDARIHFEGTNAFNYFAFISQNSTINTNGPFCSIGNSGNDTLTINNQTFLCENFCGLSVAAWSAKDGNPGVLPVIPGTAKFSSANEFTVGGTTYSTDYSIVGDFTNGTAVTRGNYA